MKIIMRNICILALEEKTLLRDCIILNLSEEDLLSLFFFFYQWTIDLTTKFNWLFDFFISLYKPEISKCYLNFKHPRNLAILIVSHYRSLLPYLLLWRLLDLSSNNSMLWRYFYSVNEDCCMICNHATVIACLSGQTNIGTIYTSTMGQRWMASLAWSMAIYPSSYSLYCLPDGRA
jgi:hypothetical protein